jgi:hypothetical protein
MHLSDRLLASQFGGRHLWASGYFAASSGNVANEVIAQYIEMQDKIERARDDDFQIGDDGGSRLSADTLKPPPSGGWSLHLWTIPKRKTVTLRCGSWSHGGFYGTDSA